MVAKPVDNTDLGQAQVGDGTGAANLTEQPPVKVLAGDGGLALIEAGDGMPVALKFGVISAARGADRLPAGAAALAEGEVGAQLVARAGSGAAGAVSAGAGESPVVGAIIAVVVRRPVPVQIVAHRIQVRQGVQVNQVVVVPVVIPPLGDARHRPVSEDGVVLPVAEVPGVVGAGDVVHIHIPVGVDAGVAGGGLQVGGGLAFGGGGVGVVGHSGGLVVPVAGHGGGAADEPIQALGAAAAAVGNGAGGVGRRYPVEDPTAQGAGAGVGAASNGAGGIGRR